MQRVTLSLDDDLLAEVDALIQTRGYQNRSEAVRDLVRAGLQDAADTSASGPCIAALFYIYDHEARELSRRLTRTFHDHHDLSLTSLHVHLDHGSCLEVSLLKGETQQVRTFADKVITERGVRHGQVIVVPVEHDETHPHHHPHHHD
ncbi:nickel-responsive transcriptional regulator NikR [Atlantibacter hermannii]|nr:nickel-responsive transcriptional regulator NikR [Atlantibacter hermannii]NBC99194.1 nickel-responsive transcriptional regulator NikR [Atlantibacter hermannii]